MMINDPLSDMIARIRNAAMRKRSKVLTPASRLRQRVLDAHRTLMDLNEQNRESFRDLVTALETGAVG
jgi:ribosomal protein S8